MYIFIHVDYFYAMYTMTLLHWPIVEPHCKPSHQQPVTLVRRREGTRRSGRVSTLVTYSSVSNIIPTPALSRRVRVHSVYWSRMCCVYSAVETWHFFHCMCNSGEAEVRVDPLAGEVRTATVYVYIVCVLCTLCISLKSTCTSNSAYIWSWSSELEAKKKANVHST